MGWFGKALTVLAIAGAGVVGWRYLSSREQGPETEPEPEKKQVPWPELAERYRYGSEPPAPIQEKYLGQMFWSRQPDGKWYLFAGRIWDRGDEVTPQYWEFYLEPRLE